jgi:hypothetical protein
LMPSCKHMHKTKTHIHATKSNEGGREGEREGERERQRETEREKRERERDSVGGAGGGKVRDAQKPNRSNKTKPPQHDPTAAIEDKLVHLSVCLSRQ